LIDVRNLSIPHVLQVHAKATPSAPAVVSKKGRLTWGELVARANRIANGLRWSGLESGDRVVLLFDNSEELLELILGTMVSGGVVVPLSGLMTQEVVCRMTRASGARFVFAQDRFLGRFASDDLREIGAERRFTTKTHEGWTDYKAWLAGQSAKAPVLDYLPDASISILYTSGTTGTPKGMEHSHFARLLYPLVLGPLMGIGRDSVVVLSTPMYHNGTWTTMLPALYAGGTVVIEETFSANGFQDTVSRERCTHVFMVPTQLILLAADSGFDPAKLGSMKTIMISGAPLPGDTLEAVRNKLKHVDLCEIYGMGEGFMTFSSARKGKESGVGSVGRPIAEADTDIQIIDDSDGIVEPGAIGEIVGTSSFMLKGYFGDPEATSKAVWIHPEDGRAYLRSGDLGRFDGDGFLHLAGRKKDMIISGGVKVYATDIEGVFMSHPDVLEVAAIAIPHEKWGETPLLLAVMKPSADVGEDELREWGNRQLGKTQRVSRVEFRSFFPRNSLDKIVKRELREPYWKVG
jgi:acyl-CoA synthetase (AMP-forming)/AMP-acid ligase II